MPLGRAQGGERLRAALEVPPRSFEPGGAPDDSIGSERERLRCSTPRTPDRTHPEVGRESSPGRWTGCPCFPPIAKALNGAGDGYAAGSHLSISRKKCAARRSSFDEPTKGWVVTPLTALLLRARSHRMMQPSPVPPPPLTSSFDQATDFPAMIASPSVCR